MPRTHKRFVTTARRIAAIAQYNRNQNNGAFKIVSGAGILTLDGAGLSAANQPFGFANVAALVNTGVGAFAVNSDISLASSTDIGTTSGVMTIGGAITATGAVNLNFRANGRS